MDAIDREKLTPLVGAVLASTRDNITRGLSATDAEWVLAALRQTILPYRLRQAQDTPPKAQAATVAQVSVEVNTTLASLKPHERMQAIMLAYYRSVLAPFSEAAFGLARRFVEQTGNQESLRDEARMTLRAVNTFMTQLRQEAPPALALLRSELSETILDCRHVLNETPFISRRLSHFLDHLAARKERCPHCGAEPSPEARFCPECGARLRR